MILCDFLSRISADKGDPMDLVPVAFNVLAILQERYNHMTDFKVMTREQRAAAGLNAPPPVHGAQKLVDPNLKPETQAARSRKEATINQPNQVHSRSDHPTPILVPSRSETNQGNSRSKVNHDATTPPVNNQVRKNESSIPDPSNKVVERPTTRSILTPELLGPLPLLTPNTRSVRTEDDHETQQIGSQYGCPNS